MGDRDPDFFKFHYRQWKRRMHKLRVPFGLQGALLCIVIDTHLTGAPPADEDFVLAGVMMVSPRKARAVVNKLLALKLVCIEGGMVVDKTAVEDETERSQLREIRSAAGRQGGIRSGEVRALKATEKSNFVPEGHASLSKVDGPHATLSTPSDGFASDKSLKDNDTREACSQVGFELEKRREEKKESTPLPPSGGRDIDPVEFEEWYDFYPRKVAKGAARRAFKKARKQAEQADLVTAVKSYSATVVGKDKEFIPYPAKWLNSEQWLDSNEAPSASTPASIEKRVDVAKDWLSRNSDIPTWMDSVETAEMLVKEGYDYDKLRRAGFSLPPRGNIVDIAKVGGARASIKTFGGDKIP